MIFVAFGIVSCKTDNPDSENILQKFSVTFDSDGGSKVKGQVIESGKTATKPENPTKDGYDFEVWVLEESPFDFSTLIISDITLKAKWTKHTSTTLPEEQKQFFTVTFDTNGGSGIVSQKIENGKTVTKPENPTKDGYDFEVWVLEESPFDFSTLIISDITLKAKWTKHTSTTLPEEQKQFFTVTFDTNGGSGIVSQKIENGKTAARPEEPYRERYNFIGWFLGDNKFDFSTPITSDITLKAKWDGQVFIVSFDSDGGTEINDQYIYKYGYAIEPTNPKKDSCIFAGWFIDDTKFDFTSTQINADITLKAKWTQIFTVTFDSNGGTITIGGTNMTDWTSQALDGKTITKPRNNPSKENYTFIGWYNDESEFDFSSPITSDLTLKAKWEKKVSVTFDYNGAGSNFEIMVDKGSLVTSRNASWTKHKFLGWYNGDILFDFSTPITSDITLTAKWVKLFTVKFDYDDVDHNVETKEVEEGQLITDVPNESKQSGYTLARWMLNDTDFDFENTVITASITLKAKYYCDSITSTLTMKNGWHYDYNPNETTSKYPIVEAVIISRKGKTLDSGAIIRQELTYPNKGHSAYGSVSYDHDVKLSITTLGTFTYDGHKYGFWLQKNNGDNFHVERQKYSYDGYETKFSIVEVKRDNQKKNRYTNWVDVISIYIDVDF